jgi:hypothetical protein
MAFEGSPIMGTRRATTGYDWSKGGAGLPAGFSYVAATPGGHRPPCENRSAVTNIRVGSNDAGNSTTINGQTVGGGNG